MEEYTYEEAKKAYNDYYSSTGKNNKFLRSTLRKNGVFGVVLSDDVNEKGDFYYKDVGISRTKNDFTLFPKKGGGFIGIENPHHREIREKLGRSDLIGDHVFNENLELEYSEDLPIIGTEAHANPQDGGEQSTQSKPSTTAAEPTQPGAAASTPKPASAPTGGAQPAAPTTDGQPASPEKLTDLQKQFREKFPLKSEPKPEPKKSVKAGFFSEKAFISNFDENFSLTNARKRQLLETKWNKTLDEISPGAKRYTDKSMKRAMEKFSNDYNLGVDLSNYKTSMLGRIANRVIGNKNISKEEALERTLGAYSKKTNEYINNLKEQYQSGKITDRQYMRRANRGWTRAAANGGERVPKSRNLEKLGWKGKGLAAVGLVALGGVISNMFSGGKKSNAELYNPNPQPQYYS